MHQGYVKLWRKSLKSQVWKNADLWRFWCWCLMKASHTETDELSGYQSVKLMPGQFLFGRKVAARETGLSERTVRTCLLTLQKLQNVTTKTTNKFSVLTVGNWELYQNCDADATSKMSNERPANDQQMTTFKNVKNDKKNIKDTDNSQNEPSAAKPKKREKSDPRPSACPPDRWDKYLTFSRNYHLDRAATLGNIAPFTETKVIAGAKVLDNLVRVRGIDPGEIKAVLDWAQGDSFWNDNCRALAGLTKVGSNGEIKYSNILAAMRRELV